jgi:predicted aldo/keto reductase-like oxidoreductase
MSRLLERSLKRMHTDTIDLYLLHGIRSTSPLTDRVRLWAERAKADGKIRLFGFSTHSNMEECLLKAAGLGWIDGIMMSYNYRLMQKSRMQEAVKACARAGIGLTAMKTQGGGQLGGGEPGLATGFLDRGFTEYQAKLKVVWENRHIASICSQMENMTLLMANAAAALDRTELSATQRRLLRRVARRTEASYCTGCARHCEPAVEGRVPIADVMRCLMYSRSYGDHRRAREDFARLAPQALTPMETADYRLAERRCPQGMPIGRLVREAVVELA